MHPLGGCSGQLVRILNPLLLMMHQQINAAQAVPRIAGKSQLSMCLNLYCDIYVDDLSRNCSKKLDGIEQELELMDDKSCSGLSGRDLKNHNGRLNLILEVNLFYKSHMQRGRTHLRPILIQSYIGMRNYFNPCLSFLGTKNCTRIKHIKNAVASEHWHCGFPTLISGTQFSLGQVVAMSTIVVFLIPFPSLISFSPW